MEDVEDREQPLGRRNGAALHLTLQPVARPPFLADAEELEHELVLRGEVPVERHLRDTRLGHDRVDTDRSDSAA